MAVAGDKDVDVPQAGMSPASSSPAARRLSRIGRLPGLGPGTGSRRSRPRLRRRLVLVVMLAPFAPHAAEDDDVVKPQVYVSEAMSSLLELHATAQSATATVART